VTQFSKNRTLVHDNMTLENISSMRVYICIYTYNIDMSMNLKLQTYIRNNIIYKKYMPL